jgi:hypothetical protein
MAEDMRRNMPGGGQGARDLRRDENREALRRQELAYRLFIAGASYEAIANTPDPNHPGQTLYAGRSGARKGVISAIERHSGFYDTEEMRKVEAMRIDALQRALWPKALGGDSWAVLRVKELMEHRAKLFGLFAPVRQQMEVITTDAVQQAIDQLLREMAANDPADGVLGPDGEPLPQDPALLDGALGDPRDLG